jgi:predicted transcriptional regulator
MRADKEKMIKNEIALLRGIVNGTIDIPDNAVVISDPEHYRTLMTPKRLELIRIIQRRHPKSVNELSRLSKRLKQAVTRDLKALEKYDIVSLTKAGRKVIPKVKRKVILFSLHLGVTQGLEGHPSSSLPEPA